MDRRYLIAVLFFTVAVVCAVVLLYPKYQQVTVSSRAADQLQADFEAHAALVQEIGRLKVQYREAEDEVGRVVKLLPALGAKSVPELFIELEGIAAQNGLLIETIVFGGSKEEEKPYKLVQAELALKGSYASFKNFMRAVELNEHLMDITQISLAVSVSSTAEKEGGGAAAAAGEQFAFKVSLNAYYQ